MITLSTRLRKFTLVTHVASSVALLGAVAAFLVLAITGLVNENGEIVRAAYIAMNIIAEDVIVPLALASLLVGIVAALGTPWGLLRHYWVLAKLVLTLFGTAVLLIQMPRIGLVAAAAATSASSSADYRADRLTLMLHSVGGLLVLLAPLGLSFYKPPGMTRYGQRKRFDKSSAPLVV